MTKLSWTGQWLPVVHRLPGEHRRAVALSIDDGPTDATPDLLHSLAQAKARATFFLSGCRVVERPKLVEAILAGGHEIYAHGYAHERLDERGDPAAIVEALGTGEKLLAAYRPTPKPYLVRLPYAAGRRQAWVHRAIRAWSADAQIAHWECSLHDHEIAGRCRDRGDVARLCAAAVAEAARLPGLAGSIVLLHDQPFDTEGPFVRDVTVTLGDLLVEKLAADGYVIVPVRPHPRPSLASRFVLKN